MSPTLTLLPEFEQALADGDAVCERWPVDCAEARDCVEQALWTLQGALLTGDGRLVADTAQWVSALLAARSVPGTPTTALGAELTMVLRDYPLTVDLLRSHWDAP